MSGNFEPTQMWQPCKKCMSFIHNFYTKVDRHWYVTIANGTFSDKN